MKLKIEIEMENEAFEADRLGEASRILRGMTAGLRHNGMNVGDVITLRDINGNTVGKAEVVA